MHGAEIRFCWTADGVRIAYATIGAGPALVMPPGWVGHLERSWEDPALRAFLGRLARHRTFVWYDKHGCGLSDRDRTDFSLDSELPALEGVVDHLKLRRFALLGISQGGPTSIAYVVKYPRRVTHLVLYGTYARGSTVAPPDVRASFTALVRSSWGLGSRALADMFLPEGDAAGLEWFARFQREAATAQMAASLLTLTYDVDIVGLLPRVRVPTLVLHRRGDRATPFRAGRELASLLPNARFMPLDGNDHAPYLGDTDAVVRAIAEFLGDPVGDPGSGWELPPAAAEPLDSTAAAVSERQAALEARTLLAHLGEVVLSRYRIVGSYTRYDDAVRHALTDARQNIIAGLTHPTRKRENHLIWAAPGSGKSFFVQQTAAALDGVITYRELNLAKLEEAGFRAGLAELDRQTRPCLCLIDECDAKPEASWPYELLLPYLDAAVERGAPFVFVLAGSGGADVAELKRRMAARPKGTDLLSRIPSMNEYVIAPMGVGDRLLVVLSQFREAGREAGRDIGAVEKLGLYYVALSQRLTNARQLREFAVRAVERVPPGDDRLKYDHLFAAGDPENKAFWLQAGGVAQNLMNHFITLTD